MRVFSSWSGFDVIYDNYELDKLMLFHGGIPLIPTLKDWHRKGAWDFEPIFHVIFGGGLGDGVT